MRHKLSSLGVVNLVMLACLWQASPAAAIDRHNPAVVKQTLDAIMERPRPPATSTASFYADSVSHFDSFVPMSFQPSETFDPEKHHFKFTYWDGRIGKCESIDASGNCSALFDIWNDTHGAPVLAVCSDGGNREWYMYAEYNDSGKLQTIYSFNKSFELNFFDSFSYEGKSTLIKRFERDQKLRIETLYDGEDVYLIEGGVKRKVNHITREQENQTLVKFGLKPIYPDRD